VGNSTLKTMKLGGRCCITGYCLFRGVRDSVGKEQSFSFSPDCVPFRLQKSEIFSFLARSELIRERIKFFRSRMD
jgi:hypothetical protein